MANYINSKTFQSVTDKNHETMILQTRCVLSSGPIKPVNRSGLASNITCNGRMSILRTRASSPTRTTNIAELCTTNTSKRKRVSQNPTKG